LGDKTGLMGDRHVPGVRTEAGDAPWRGARPKGPTAHPDQPAAAITENPGVTWGQDTG
jgi:hypothetical protein